MIITLMLLHFLPLKCEGSSAVNTSDEVFFSDGGGGSHSGAEAEDPEERRF